MNQQRMRSAVDGSLQPVALSLLSLDDALSVWLGRSGVVSEPFEKHLKEALLRRVMGLWPLMLKLLIAYDKEAELDRARENLLTLPICTPWLPFAIRAVDRLMKTARQVPLGALNDEIWFIESEIRKLHSGSVELINLKVQEEKAVFWKKYKTCESRVHRAVDYWPLWEQGVRERAMEDIQAKIEELQAELEQKGRRKDDLMFQQEKLADRWAEVRSRIYVRSSEEFDLLPGQDQGNGWWGTLPKASRFGGGPGALNPLDIDTELRENDGLTLPKVANMPLLNKVIQALTRLCHVSAVASSDESFLSKVKATPPPSSGGETALLYMKIRYAADSMKGAEEFHALKVLTLQLLTNVRDVLNEEHGRITHSTGSIIEVSDSLLACLSSRDEALHHAAVEALKMEIQLIKKKIEDDKIRAFKKEEERRTEKNFLLMNDPVVSRFWSDNKDRLAEAAAEKVSAALKATELEDGEEGSEGKTASTLMEQERRLDKQKTDFEVRCAQPWREIQVHWQDFVGRPEMREKEEDEWARVVKEGLLTKKEAETSRIERDSRVGYSSAV